MTNRSGRSCPVGRPTKAAFLVAVLAGVGLTGCGTGEVVLPPPMTADDRAAEFQIDEGGFASLGYRLDWRGFPPVERGGRIESILTSPDAIVVHESGNATSVLEPTTGAVRWSNALSNTLTRFVGLARRDGVVLSTSESEIFQLAVATGELVGRQPLERVVNTPPLLLGDLLIFGTARGEVIAHSLGYRLTAWAFGTPGAIDHPLVVVGGAVGAVTQTGAVLFLDPGTGSLVGRNRIFGPPGGDPATGANLMFVASTDQSLYAFAGNGGAIWRLRTGAPLTTPPAFHAGRLYVELPDSGFNAFDPMSSTPAWSNPQVQGVLVGERKGSLLVWDAASSTLSQVEKITGDVLARVPVPGAERFVADSPVDGNLFGLSRWGVVAKFSPRD
ncbi:MAG: hypothetical protein FJ255_02380 [Phycisphaerae bacterium]|nr:hypothetical protein [Phycisphaerae bacterium]